MAAQLQQVDMSDETLLAMLKNPNFTIRFPFMATTLARASARKPGCGNCKNRNQPVRIDYGQLRRQIGELPQQEKVKLKQLLNAKQVVVKYNRANGQAVKLKF